MIHDHTGLMGLALGGLLSTPLVHTVHGPVSGQPGDLYEQVVRMAPNARLVSLSMSQREPRPQLPWIANVPNALDLSFYPFRPERGRLPAVPRADEPRQGRAPGRGDRAGDRAAAEDRRQVRRAGRAGVLRPVRPPAPRRRSRVRRRGHARREGRAAAARAGNALPDLLGGAVRPRHDRVDGLRHARDRDPLGRRPRGGRPRPHRHHRQRVARDGGRARGGRRARLGRAAARGRAAVHARADGGRLPGRLRGSPGITISA